MPAIELEDMSEQWQESEWELKRKRYPDEVEEMLSTLERSVVVGKVERFGLESEVTAIIESRRTLWRPVRWEMLMVYQRVMR